jgi:patatin-related protein
MRETELRLAIVLTGGVSLAVFMHGVSRELLKLVRASKIYHALPDPRARLNASYATLNDDPARESDTEHVYFDLLKAIAPATDLRVLIDVIAGASAGGVNGVMLARALAHDQPLDDHRAMWLEHADAIDLMDETALAKPMSKIYLEPFSRVLLRAWLLPLARDLETRAKLRTFVRSRWFKPPFSGPRFIGWMLDACDAMEEGRDEAHSLLPDAHPLDLIVSVTDFHGHQRMVRLHDPARIVEAEHLHLFRFGYERTSDGHILSDFDRDGVPGLIFAARATASFPGAFPPATVKEMDQVLEARGRAWPRRARFLADKFKALSRSGRDPETAAFIDGSTVNDKPFAAAIGALSARPAQREVLRRLIYVDPAPGGATNGTNGANGVPGMMRTVLAALVEIPGNDPVRAELERLDEVNRRIRVLRQVIDLSRPEVAAQVETIVGAWAARSPSRKRIARWRETANARVARNSGFAFDSYFRLKMLSVLGHLERLICALAERGGGEADQDVVAARVRRWAEARFDALTAAARPGSRDGDIDFLRAFDVDYRVRRLRFVIRRLNELYGLSAEGGIASSTEDLDSIKTLLYRHLEQVKRRWSGEFFSVDLAADAAAWARFDAGRQPLDALTDAIAAELDLNGADEAVDEMFATATVDYLDRPARREVLTAYVGFCFFDVVSFPMVQWEDLDELDEVLIHRISPEDARAIRRGGDPVALKGTGLRHFGGFFNRPYREHDYLWGRLTAADRLIDVVLDATGTRPQAVGLDVGALKRRLFASILEAEAPFLKADPALFDEARGQLVGGSRPRLDEAPVSVATPAPRPTDS